MLERAYGFESRLPHKLFNNEGNIMGKKFFGIIVSMLLAATVIFAQSEMNPDAAKLYNEGNKLFKSGDYNGALEKYEASTKIEENFRTEYQKGIVFNKLRDLKQAENAFSRALELKPDFGIAYNALGGVFYREGKYQEAIDSFVKFQGYATKEKHKSKADVNISRAYTKLGEAAKANGNFEKAVENLNKATEYNDYDAAYLLLAETLIDLGRNTKALEAADKASNFRKSIPKGAPYYYKGLAFLNLGDNEKAREAFQTGRKDSKYRTLCDYQLENNLN